MKSNTGFYGSPIRHGLNAKSIESQKAFGYMPPSVSQVSVKPEGTGIMPYCEYLRRIKVKEVSPYTLKSSDRRLHQPALHIEVEDENHKTKTITALGHGSTLVRDDRGGKIAKSRAEDMGRLFTPSQNVFDVYDTMRSNHFGDSTFMGSTMNIEKTFDTMYLTHVYSQVRNQHPEMDDKEVWVIAHQIGDNQLQKKCSPPQSTNTS